jgi:hypothetical protein
MECAIMTTAEGCMFDSATGLQTGVVIHYEYGKDANGAVILHKTRYTNAAGVPIALAATQVVTAGVCQPIALDVEWVQLCDDDADPATDNAAFLRKYTTTRNSLTGAIITEVVEDFELDMETPYTVVGTAAQCATGAQDVEDIILCDSLGLSFIRRSTFVNGVRVTVADLALDGATAFVPTGTVGACPSCAPKTAVGVVSAW